MEKKSSWTAYKIQAEIIAKSQILSKVEKARLLSELKSKLMSGALPEFKMWLDSIGKYYILKEDYERLIGISEAKVSTGAKREKSLKYQAEVGRRTGLWIE